MDSIAMANPFDDHAAAFLALTAPAETPSGGVKRSLWPAFIDVPAGWAVEFGPASRDAALGHIERAQTT
jgi:MbtH protein